MAMIEITLIACALGAFTCPAASVGKTVVEKAGNQSKRRGRPPIFGVPDVEFLKSAKEQGSSERRVPLWVCCLIPAVLVGGGFARAHSGLSSESCISKWPHLMGTLYTGYGIVWASLAFSHLAQGTCTQVFPLLFNFPIQQG
jgi:hypothetical protein